MFSFTGFDGPDLAWSIVERKTDKTEVGSEIGAYKSWKEARPGTGWLKSMSSRYVDLQ